MAKTVGDESGTAALLCWRCGKLKRVSHSSFDGELIECVDTLDSATGISLFFEEAFQGKRESRIQKRLDALESGVEPTEDAFLVQVECHTDAKCITSRVEAMTLDPGMRKARKTDLADLRDAIERGLILCLKHVTGVDNPAEALTKAGARTKRTMERLKEVVGGVYLPILGG